MNYWMKRADYILFFILTLSFVIGHWGHFNLSPRGVHVWRQCNTLAVAKNFYQEDMNIMHPRVDHRKHTSGITGSAFPLYEYILAVSYKLFGFHHMNHRILQLLITLIGVLGLYLLVLHWLNNSWAAALASFAYLWSPELYYHGINALPDVVAMTSLIWSAYFYRTSKGSPIALVFCIGLLSVAGLVKLQFMLFGLMYFIHSLFERNYSKAIGISMLGLLGSGLVVNWYIHSIQLRYASNLQDYGLFLNPAKTVSEGLQVLKQNAIMDIPEQLIGYGMLALVLWGLWQFHKRQSIAGISKAWTFFFIFFVFHIFELKQMEHHAYYMMPYIVMAALLIGYGVLFIPLKYRIYILLPLILIQIGHTVSKINTRYDDRNSGLPSSFLDPETLVQLQKAAKHSHAALVGPDASGCIYFYYLEVKGWNAFGMDQIENKDDIHAAMQSGKIECMLIQNMDEERKQKYSKEFKEMQQIGTFTVFNR